ncbi:MAG: YggT family protein [Kangiella sp.]|nr:MAG: YggT family protein [Kangiella sp.]
MMNPFSQLIDVLISLYVTVILLRFFLQYFRADFYNPLSQFCVKATDPLIKPLRKVIPGFAGIDFSSLVLAYIVILVKLLLMTLIAGQLNINFLLLVLITFVGLIKSVLNLFVFLIFIRIIMSWISPGGHNPVMAVIGQLSEPIIGVFKKILPPMSGFDFSPMIALIMIYFTMNMVDYYLVPVIQSVAY